MEIRRSGFRKFLKSGRSGSGRDQEIIPPHSGVQELADISNQRSGICSSQDKFAQQYFRGRHCQRLVQKWPLFFAQPLHNLYTAFAQPF